MSVRDIGRKRILSVGFFVKALNYYAIYAGSKKTT